MSNPLSGNDMSNPQIFSIQNSTLTGYAHLNASQAVVGNLF